MSGRVTENKHVFFFFVVVNLHCPAKTGDASYIKIQGATFDVRHDPQSAVCTVLLPRLPRTCGHCTGGSNEAASIPSSSGGNLKRMLSTPPLEFPFRAKSYPSPCTMGLILPKAILSIQRTDSIRYLRGKRHTHNQTKKGLSAVTRPLFVRRLRRSPHKMC